MINKKVNVDTVSTSLAAGNEYILNYNLEKRREQVRKATRAYRKVHRERLLKEQREKRMKPEVKEQERKYREKHKPKRKVWLSENKDKVKKYAQKHYKKYKDRILNDVKAKDSYYKRKYGITFDRYNEMLKEQNGVCAICFKPPKNRRLAVDHNHKSGKVRKLLCWMCNNVLGRWYDNPQRFERAAEYLRENL